MGRKRRIKAENKRHYEELDFSNILTSGISEDSILGVHGEDHEMVVCGEGVRRCLFCAFEMRLEAI